MQTEHMIQWEVTTSGQPSIIKHCPKCGGSSLYRNSEKFRVNANKKSLDIWLIYICQNCDDTYNLSIYERVKPASLNAQLLDAFMANDKTLATQCGFDVSLHKKAEVKQDFSSLKIEIIGESLPSGQATVIHIMSREHLGLRLDWLLSQKLKLSRSQIKKLILSGAITALEGSSKALEKEKLNREIRLRVQL